jgi:hypothetical protein
MTVNLAVLHLVLFGLLVDPHFVLISVTKFQIRTEPEKGTFFE